VAEQIVCAELRYLYLGHLSSDCNRPELARRVVSETLGKLGATHIRIEAASPDVPCATLCLETAAVMAAPTVPGARADRPASTPEFHFD
jgi:hypothetical protein